MDYFKLGYFNFLLNYLRERITLNNYFKLGYFNFLLNYLREWESLTQHLC